MEYLGTKVQVGKEAIATDTTLLRTVRYGDKAVRAAPSVAGQYLLEKAPIVQWLPKYDLRWLLNDTLAGITVGVLLIPQSLAYAKIATIPGQYGLMSSWLPNFLYLIMGTSKGRGNDALMRQDTDTMYRSIDRSYLAHRPLDCGDYRRRCQGRILAPGHCVCRRYVGWYIRDDTWSAQTWFSVGVHLCTSPERLHLGGRHCHHAWTDTFLVRHLGRIRHRPYYTRPLRQDTPV